MKRILILIAAAVLLSAHGSAQQRAEINPYDFRAVLADCRDSMDVCTDSVALSALKKVEACAENGLAMMGYCHRPNVISRRMFSRSDFHLWFPLEDRAWHLADSSALIYIPGAVADSLSLPVRDSLDFMPVQCGQNRYFASRDLPGMGGYDLFVSRWNPSTRTWGEPENLGFPYSSPCNDYLLVNTDDGRFTVFASDRGCPADSVNIYVLEYDVTPVREAVRKVSNLEQLCRLDPAVAEPQAGAVRDENTSLYLEKLGRVRALRDSAAVVERKLDVLRDRYAVASAAEKTSLVEKITDGEIALTVAQAELDKASRELRRMEDDFAMKGIEIDIPSASAAASAGYEFKKKNPGKPVHVIWNY